MDITQGGIEFVDALLKRIVPEYDEGQVNIDKIARFNGKRTKILVSSNDEKVDPVGVFVGHHGDRINTVLSLLNGEKIDIIENTEDPVRLVQDVLKPAKTRSIEIANGKAIVKVDEDQKSLAIGKGAVNIRLATQLTGLRIELV